jgi:hypothetical protein
MAHNKLMIMLDSIPETGSFSSANIDMIVNLINKTGGKD